MCRLTISRKPSFRRPDGSDDDSDDEFTGPRCGVFEVMASSGCRSAPAVLHPALPSEVRGEAVVAADA